MSRRWPWLMLITGLALGLVLLIGLLFFKSSTSWASGCSSEQSITKHATSHGPISDGQFMSDTKLVVHWCYAHDRITDHDEWIKNRWRNCIFGWCYNLKADTSTNGWWTDPDHHKRVITGHVEFCQDFFVFGCAFHDSMNFDGWIKAGGETSFLGGPYSGGGGGGSWAR